MTIRSYVAVAAVAMFVAPTVSWAGKLTCLTGTDPSVADDLTEIATVRDVIDAQCSCASFDGSLGKTHVRYVSCVNAVLGTEVSAGTIRSQCKATVKKYYSVSTCGVPASKGKAPCIKTSATGKVKCAIKPATKCTDAGKVACPNFALCIDAADSNGDGIIGAGDSGACNAADNPTNTPTTSPTPTKTPTRAPTATPLNTPTNTPTNSPTPIPTATHTFTSTATFTFSPTPTITPTPCTGFCDNGDGTITDTSTGLMWEKKDQSGGIHDEHNTYTWSSTGTAADGTVFTVFLATLNTPPCFAGHCDWRLPTSAGCCGYPTGQVAELESIVDTNVSGCNGSYTTPCVVPAFNTNCTPGCSATSCSCTEPYGYWSGSTVSATPGDVFLVGFFDGDVGYSYKKGGGGTYVRAVR